MKKLLIVLMMLIASASYSQDIIQITPYQAKEAIKTRQRVQKLEIAVRQQGLAIAEFKMQVEDLHLQLADAMAQTNLWKKNYDLLNTRLDSEKAKKPGDNTLIWILRCIGAAAVGFVAGDLIQ